MTQHACMCKYDGRRLICHALHRSLLLGKLEPVSSSLLDAASKPNVTHILHSCRVTAKSFKRKQSTAQEASSGAPPTATQTEGSESPMLSPLRETPSNASALAAESSDALASEDSSEFAEGTCPPEFWSCPGAAGFKVRGERYLRDHVKVR